MSKTIKTVASIALPIVGTLAAPGIGTYLGSTLGAATLGGIGGAIGGAAGGALKGGGLKGAAIGGVLGGAGGYLSSGGASELFGGTAFGDALGLSAPGVGGVGPIASGASGAYSAGENAFLNSAATAGNAPVGGAVTGGALRSLTSNIGNVLTAGNAISAFSGGEAAEEAARLQAAGVDKATAAQQPYTELGQNAVNQLNTIQSDPNAYVQNNPLYKNLADDAQRRLLANQASKGKVASGGTAAALQDQLLQIGNGLVQQQIGNYQQQAGIGQGSAAITSNLAVDKGAAQSAGVQGKNNAYQGGYQNQIATLLAMQGLGNTPSYQTITGLNR